MNGTNGYFRDKTVLVTGASSGIGEELAWQLGLSGAKLTLAARRQAALETLADRILRVVRRGFDLALAGAIVLTTSMAACGGDDDSGGGNASGKTLHVLIGANTQYPQEMQDWQKSVADKFKAQTDVLEKLLDHSGGSAEKHAKYMRDKIIPAMVKLRELGDQIEVLTPHEIWPLPTYREMLFVK